MENLTLDSVLDAHTTDTTINKDLRLNLKRVLENGELPSEEGMLALLATATSVDHQPLADYARAQLKKADFSADQIQEAAESAAIMAMLNTYYRFKHMLNKDDEYGSAGLRMISLGKPALGKERFEMLAFAVSVLNGCENCIRSHEQVLRDAGLSVNKIHDLARLASVVKGLKTLDYIGGK